MKKNERGKKHSTNEYHNRKHFDVSFHRYTHTFQHISLPNPRCPYHIRTMASWLYSTIICCFAVDLSSREEKPTD